MAIDRGQGISVTTTLADSYDVGNLIEDAQTAESTATTKAGEASTSASSAATSASAAATSATTASDARDDILDFTLSVSTLAAGASATASYDELTGVLSLGLPQGVAGAVGSNWTSGTANPDNANGVDGDFYFDSDDDKIFKKASGAWTLLADITGPPGADSTVAGPQGIQGNIGNTGADSTVAGPAGNDGDDGSVWTNSTNAPSGGVDGDFHLKTDNGDVYKNTLGTWSIVANIIGPTGQSGSGTGDVIAANNLLDLVNAATARTNIGVAIGTDVQAYDANIVSDANYVATDLNFTSVLSGAITANTAKTGITSAQASAITANTAKVGITAGQASAITANTAKVGITAGQASAITANTAKVGITTGQASAITANTAKVGITTGQASAITANTAHKDSAHAPSGAEANAANTAITTADQSWTGSQRATLVVDNDGSFDMNGGNNFKCTPAAGITLTFTNIANGQSGFILLVNSGGHTIAAAGTSKVDANLLTTVSTAGTYLMSYFSDGTNVYLTNSAIYS